MALLKKAVIKLLDRRGEELSSENICRGLAVRIFIGISRIMNFRHIKVVLFLSITALLLTGSSAAQDSLVILNASDDSTMLQNIEYIESIGGTIAHRFPPHILIGDIPASQLISLKGHGNIVDIATKSLNASLVKGYGKTAEIAVGVWNNNYPEQPEKKGPVSPGKPDPGPIIGDMLFAPDKGKGPKTSGVTARPVKTASEIQVQTLPYGGGFYDTSEYMIGDIAVGIILLESNGSIDTSTEDWTTGEESNVLSEIQAGLNWWRAREPNATLTFTYDIHYAVPTSYEPIQHPQIDESLWITDAMTGLGHTGSDYFDKVYDYDNTIRQLFNTDWAFTIFIVDSSNDTDGLFTDRYFAYAYLGGPLAVMTYDNDGYGISNMDAVIAHETGHIFYANDQYTQANSPCNEKTGYLDIENQNSAFPHAGACASNVASIMRSQVSPYTSKSLDTYARQQVGWRDTDADGIMDIIDFVPVSNLNTYYPDPAYDSTPTFTGSSSTTSTYPNNNQYGLRNAITINKISNVQYRVDNGSWINALPVDGSFNSSEEDFTFTISSISNGTHTIEVRAQNTAGNWETSYASDSLTFIMSYGYINGTVQYNGTGVAGAIVSTNTSIKTNTNESGFYSLLVPAAMYNITAISEPGFYANRSIVVEAISDTTIVQDIQLIKKPTGTITGHVANE